jgi:hypothetical protein
VHLGEGRETLRVEKKSRSVVTMYLEFTELQNLVVWSYLNASSATRSMCVVEINIL